LCASVASAQESTNRAELLLQFQKLESSLTFEKGEVNIQHGLARLTLPPQFRYLSPADANTVLVKMWGNPPGQETLGMIVPGNMSVLNPESWAVVISYDADGYVKDSDADSINYSKLLKQMKTATKEGNVERKKAGYPELEIIGWATEPRYDKTTHKFYWAKELKFGDSDENTLNYNFRVLGRRGVLTLTAVASMRLFPNIEKQAPEIVKMVEFTSGNRYEDFDKQSDKTAVYGLAALVTGGVAAKAGFFKVLWIGLLAAKKFVILGIIALFAILKKFFSRKGSS
jgi:uncharacterized membrane-anchored protein